MNFNFLFFTLFFILFSRAQEVKTVFNDEFIKSCGINNEEYTTIKNSFSKYIKDFDVSTSVNYWIINEKSVFDYPDEDFVNLMLESQKENLSIFIQAIKKVNPDTYQIELSFLKNIDCKLEIYTVYKVFAKLTKSEFKYINNIDFEKKYNKYQTKTITFFSENSIDFNQANVFEEENKNLSKFFETDIINFKYFKSKSVYNFMSDRGYLLERTMLLPNQNGAETFVGENLIFSGNNSEVNIHELTHLYIFKCFPNRHNLIDEGLATYLGGSKGLSYKEHLKNIYLSIKDKNINLYNELFFGNYVVDDTSSLWYTAGALLCDIAVEKGGKKMLFELINSGKRNIDLFKKIEDIFSVEEDKIDDLLKHELKRKYDQYYP
ncbi:hypothetical protein [Flavobacterium sp.]|jgi:hypothetical protein|uniref:hypothetical protein n=1 Tax=Flavobacterium sp. TaxID=239 RepID=UPI0037BFA0E4